jgi:hypothetical protein
MTATFMGPAPGEELGGWVRRRETQELGELLRQNLFLVEILLRLFKFPSIYRNIIQ